MISFLREFVGKLRSPQGSYFMAENKRYAAYEIGEGTYGRPNITFYDAGATLKIGSYCSIGPGVTILLGGEHHLDWVTTYPFSLLFDDARLLKGYPHTKGDVVIGSDVWIGQEAMVLSGVTIGDGAAVAARSVVTKDVEPYSIVAGNPARHIRFRFSEPTIRSLLSIAWWKWPPEQVRAARPLLQSADVDGFIAKYSKNLSGPTT
jgi:virginiamycin A acetyltransferase